MDGGTTVRNSCSRCREVASKSEVRENSILPILDRLSFGRLACQDVNYACVSSATSVWGVLVLAIYTRSHMFVLDVVKQSVCP
jgi:hypothetical protein